MHVFTSLLASFTLASGVASAATYDLTINGTDSIFLAGRTDISIPAANLPWGDNSAATEDGMRRHGGATPEESLETLPGFIPVAGGDVIKVLDPAVGGINFYNGFGPAFFGPEGASPSSSLTSFGAISGYMGKEGALAGVFLTDAIPTGSPPPATLDFNLPGGIDFETLSPEIGQVFFIGDGQNAASVMQSFIAPTGATRLFFGIPDGFGFNGVPGAYDDNDGAYGIRVGVNETPTLSTVPLPASAFLLLGGLAAIGAARRRWN